MSLVQFATFQVTRTMPKELELRAEWYAKTMAAGRLTDDELRPQTVVPHQNDSATTAARMARELVPFLMCRPLAVMTLDRPLRYTCGEPIVVNASAGDFHVPTAP